MICGQSYGVTAYLQLCLAQTVFEVEKGSVLGSADLHADLGAVRLCLKLLHRLYGFYTLLVY